MSEKILSKILGACLVESLAKGVRLHPMALKMQKQIAVRALQESESYQILDFLHQILHFHGNHALCCA